MPVLQNLTGQKFGEFVVIGISNVIKDGQRTWECLCSCGLTRYHKTSTLTKVKTKSCGHLAKTTRFSARKQTNSLAGRKFGYLEVLYQDGVYISPSNPEKTNAMWRVKCHAENCGKEFTTKGSRLTQTKRGMVTCGCSRLATKETVRERIFNETYKTYIRNAFVRKIENKLTELQIKELITKPCFYCGCEGFPPRRTGRYKNNPKKEKLLIKINGIDRIDNDGIYEINNCVSCCKFCNSIKNTYNKEDFELWLKNIKIDSQFQNNIEKKLKGGVECIVQDKMINKIQ